jgi:hypothetical protein
MHPRLPMLFAVQKLHGKASAMRAMAAVLGVHSIPLPPGLREQGRMDADLFQPSAAVWSSSLVQVPYLVGES